MEKSKNNADFARIVSVLVLLILGLGSSSYSQELIRAKNHTTSKYGFVDSQGKIVIPYKYSGVTDYTGGAGGVSWAWEGYEANPYLIDKNGKVIVNKKYKYVNSFAEGLCMVSVGGVTFGYINEKGKEVIPCQYDDGSDFSGGLARVRQKKSNKEGYIDKTGKVVIPFVFDYTTSFDNGVAMVEKSGKQMVINKTGKEAFAMGNYKIIEKFSKAVAAVYSDKKGGYIDCTGKPITEFKYVSWSLKPFKYDYAAVAVYDGKQAKHGLINKAGKELCEFKYDNIILTYNDASMFKSGNLYGIISSEGKEIVPARYREIKATLQNLFTVKDENNLWSLIDKNGNVLTKKKYPFPINAFQDDGNNCIWAIIYSSPLTYINTKGEEIDLLKQ